MEHNFRGLNVNCGSTPILLQKVHQLEISIT